MRYPNGFALRVGQHPPRRVQLRAKETNEQRHQDLIVGLDIGTSKIVALVAEVSAEGRLNVIGIGSQESKG